MSDFVDDLSDQLIQIMKDLEKDRSFFEQMGITYEEKAFYDILVKVRDDHGFPYAEDKCVTLAKEIAKLVNDKAQFADWSTRDDIKSQLSMGLTVLLYKNGYHRSGTTRFSKSARTGREHEEERGRVDVTVDCFQSGYLTEALKSCLRKMKAKSASSPHETWTGRVGTSGWITSCPNTRWNHSLYNPRLCLSILERRP